MNFDRKIVWRDEKNGLKNLSAIDICKKFYDLLLKYIDCEPQNPTFDKCFDNDIDENYWNEPNDFWEL